MLIIADKRPVRICGQSGLTGAAQAEEQCHIAVLTLIRGAVHGQYAVVMRQDKVQDTENALFHLARIGRAADQDHLACKVNDREVPLARTIRYGICQELRHLDDQPVMCKINNFLFRRTDEQVITEKIGPWCSIHNTYSYSVLRVGPGIGISYPHFLTSQKRSNLIIKGIKRFRCERDVHITPVNSLFSERILYRELIFGGTAGEFTGIYA